MNNNTELLYVFGVSAIGAASIAYIFFGPSPSYAKHQRNSRNAPIRGLQNVKNNCFINSILQSFSSSDSMVAWINCATITTRSKGKLILQMSNVINKINQNNDWEEIISPHGVLNALREHRWVFSNEEQDALELFTVLTSTLENELNHFSFMFSIREIFHTNDDISSSNLLKNYTISTKAMGKTTIAPLLNNSLPTRGILANHLVCPKCRYKYPLHLDVFDSITLSLPASSLGSSILLESCLRKFVSSEMIDDFMCEACKDKATFEKKVEFIKLPKLLCFHIQRLVWLTGERPVKRFDHVIFPEFLEMDPFTYKYHHHSLSGDITGGLLGGKSLFANSNISIPIGIEDNLQQAISPSTSEELPYMTSMPKSALARYKYVLNSVIVHLGNSSSGHFICYRRLVDRSHKIRWYCISDLAVKEVSHSEVFSCNAYMLFYERNLGLLM